MLHAAAPPAVRDEEVAGSNPVTPTIKGPSQRKSAGRPDNLTAPLPDYAESECGGEQPIHDGCACLDYGPELAAIFRYGCGRTQAWLAIGAVLQAA